MYDTWEYYFYPETYNPATGQATLRNLYGERDALRRVYSNTRILCRVRAT